MSAASVFDVDHNTHRSSAYERLRAALDPVTYERDRRLRARCPAHDGQSRTSLTVTATDDGVLVHCFAGCRTSDVLAALGYTMSDLFDGDPPPGYVPRPHRRMTVWEQAIPDPAHLVERIAQHEHVTRGAPYERERPRPPVDPAYTGRPIPPPSSWEAAHIRAAKDAALRWAIGLAREHPDVLNGETLAQHLVRLGRVAA